MYSLISVLAQPLLISGLASYRSMSSLYLILEVCAIESPRQKFHTRYEELAQRWIVGNATTVSGRSDSTVTVYTCHKRRKLQTCTEQIISPDTTDVRVNKMSRTSVIGRVNTLPLSSRSLAEGPSLVLTGAKNL